MAQAKTIPVTRKSLVTGIIRTKELPITQQQLDAYLAGQICLQDAFPDLPAPDREFIKTGITADEWQEFVIGCDE